MSSSGNSSGEEVDLDKYRKIYESDEHWTLRKSFLEAHWEKFTEDELFCLAQVFVNVEFLGCKYPNETMLQVAQLVSAVPEIQNYRAGRRNKLKRTFVGAKDAVQAKLQKSSAPRKLENERPSFGDWTNDDKRCGFKVCTSSSGKLGDWSASEKIQFETICDKTFVKFTASQKSENLRGLLKDVIFFDMGENDINGSINKTISCMQKIGKVEMKFDADDKKYFYIFDGQIVGEGASDNKKAAKKLADEDLIATLKANCYTIKSKLEYYTCESIVQPGDQDEPKPSSAGKLQENNLGFKMLKMLGWSGGALGAEGSGGIVDPISLEIKIGRKGLGAGSSNTFDLKHIRDLIKNFKNNQVEYDLVFSSEFTKEERAQIHQIAQQFDLRTKSYGKTNSRHIVISTKLSPQVLRQKLIEGDQHLLEKYEIIAPPPKKPLKGKKQ